MQNIDQPQSVRNTAVALEAEFTDISSERWREYTFPGGDHVLIHEPVLLNVSASGGHRVTDARGVSHYIPNRWIHLFWLPKEGQPSFVK